MSTPLPKPPLKLTLIGIQPPADGEPIPLNRYEARHEYTPSGTRKSCWNDYQATPLDIPLTVSRRNMIVSKGLDGHTFPRPQMAVSKTKFEPTVFMPPRRQHSVWPQVVAGAVVCYAVLMLMALQYWATNH